jgi:hypothetical protein
MRRCMSDRVGTYGGVIPPKGLDFMICLLARFRIGIENDWSVGVVVEGRITQAYVSLPGSCDGHQEPRSIRGGAACRFDG